MGDEGIDELERSDSLAPSVSGESLRAVHDAFDASETLAPTELGRAPAHASARSTRRGSKSGATLRSEADVAVARSIAEEECARARSFSLAIAGICLGSVFVLPLLGGEARSLRGAQAAIVAILAGSAYVFARTRGATSYSVGLQRAYGMLLAVGVAPIEYHLGLFSPVSCVVTLGVFFIAHSSDRIAGLAIPIFVIVRYMTTMALIAFGVVPDLGLVRSTTMEPLAKAYFIFAAPMVLGYTVWMSHVSRNGLVRALGSTQDALLLAATRDAQLEEAQQNFDRALRVIVGRPGRYTGTRAGLYELAEIIGLGAMGEVYATVDAEGRAPVAVKMMQAESSERSDLVDRFRREIEICRRLESPHVVRTLEYGVLPDGAPFLAMERLRGKDLAEILRERQRLTVGETITLVEHVAAALDEAHAAGIVHRDIKPQNVFASTDASGAITWKVLDFGISKLVGSSDTLTRAELVGTPAYMSPEQVGGRDVGPKSDVFSLAAVAYRALTGQPAFGGADVPEKLFAVAYRMPEAPSNVSPDLDPSLDDAIAIGLAKRQADRFESAGEFARALSRSPRSDVGPGIHQRARTILRHHPWGRIVQREAIEAQSA